MRQYALAVFAVLLTACATPDQRRFGDVGAAPFSDFNLAGSAIPAELLAARGQPYLAPDDPTCAGLLIQVQVLDKLLGPDIDAPLRAGEDEDAASAVGDAAAGLLRRTVEGAIPFHGWLRVLSGADKRSKEAAAAISAGHVRRGFLKGMALANACSPAFDILAADLAVDASQSADDPAARIGVIGGRDEFVPSLR